MDLALFPFTVFRQHFLAFAVSFTAIIFLVGAAVYVYGKYQPAELAPLVDKFFGEDLNKTVDLTAYDQIGANAVPPVMRLGGVANQLSVQEISEGTASLFRGVVNEANTRLLIVFLTIFFGYASFAMVSRMVFEFKSGVLPFLGLRGLNPASLLLVLIATLLIIFFAGFSLKGFELVLLLNFCVPFAFAIPLAASGLGVGESLYQSFNFIKNNLGKIAAVYLLCMGVAIAAPVALLIIFMLPLSAIDASAASAVQLCLSLFGIGFALFYQFIICSKAALDFSRRAQSRIPAYTRIAKKIR